MFDLKNTTLSFRFLRWIIPLLTLSFLLFGVTGFFVTRDSLVRFSRRSSSLLTDQTKVALVNWLQDQIYLAQTIAADPKIVNAALNPTDEQARAEAHSYLQQLHDRYKYYENMPIAIRLPPGRTYSFNVNGEPRVIKNGTFFLDTVQGRTLGKCGPDFSYIKSVFEGAPYYISEVYPSILRGNPLFVVAAPVKHDGQVIGVSVLGVRMDYFTDLFIDPAKIGETGYLMMFDETGKVIANPEKKLILNATESKKIGNITERILQGADPSFFESYEGVENLYVASRLGKNSFTAGPILMRHDWYIVSVQPVSEIVKTSRTQAYLFLVFSVLLSAIVAVVLYRHTQRTIARPILDLTRAAAAVSMGEELDTPLTSTSQDEVGELTKSIDRLRQSMRAALKRLSSKADDHH
jgi:HAMP domain-containing protein